MCVLDLESLESKLWIDGFSNVEATADVTVRLAIAGTGWSVESRSLTTKKRTLRLDSTNAYEIITKALTKWDIEVRFNAKDKVITLSDSVGEDKGVYFTDELNLSTINIEGDSTDFTTRLYVRGKDGLTFADINGGRDYIENFTYSDKVVSKLWVDERYEHKESMLEDARIKLAGMCKPVKSYELEIIDLASLSNEYDFLAYGIGDTVTLLSASNKIRESHRIIEMTRYPLEPERNKAVLSNGRLTFEELQQKNEEMADTVDGWANEDGSLNGSKVDGILTEQITDFEAKVAQITDLSVVNAKIDNLEANKASIGQLSAVVADIGELRANTATIDQLKATNAQIDNLKAQNVTISGNLQASNAQIGVLEADTATIKHLLAGNISSDNIQSGGITSDKLTIANGFIKDAMIDSLNANKIVAGRLDTALVQVSSRSGNLVINDNTIQIRDANRVRVQIGKDASNDYSMSVWDSSGKLMFDARGLKADAIKDSIIRDDMVAPGANIDGSKLNISSVVSSINNGSSTLKASRVEFDGIAQTLEVAFNALKVEVDETKSITKSNTTAINVAQGKINTLIQDTTITKNGQTIKLKDEYSRLEQTISGLSSTVGSQQTILDEHTGKITATNSEISSLKQNVDGLSMSVSSVQTTLENQTTQIEGVESTLSSLQTRVNTAEQKITDSAIVSTVTSSKTYRDELSGKVSTEHIISSINQTAEAIKINASKIDLTGYVTISNLSGNGTTSINGANIKTGVIKSTDSSFWLDLNNGRMAIYDSDKLLAITHKMKDNKSGKYGLGFQANRDSFIALSVADNDDNTVYKPYIALAAKQIGEYKPGINIKTRVEMDYNTLSNSALSYNGFKRNSGDYVILYSSNNDSSYSKLIMELGDDNKTSFEINHKFYNKSSVDRIASFRAAGGSDADAWGTVGINFYQHLSMNNYKIWGTSEIQSKSFITVKAVISSLDVEELALNKIARFNIDEDIKYRIPASLLESIEHFGHAELSDNYCRVNLPLGFNHQGYIITISPLRSGEYEIIKHDEYFEVCGDIKSFDYIVKGYI